MLFPVFLVSIDDPYLNHWWLQKLGFFSNSVTPSAFIIWRPSVKKHSLGAPPI